MQRLRPPHRAIKPGPHHLRYAARIVAVRLVDLRPQHGPHVPCLNTDHWQARFGENAVKPLRQRPSFQSNSLEVPSLSCRSSIGAFSHSLSRGPGVDEESDDTAWADTQRGQDFVVQTRQTLESVDALNIGERFRVLIKVRASRVSVRPGETAFHSCALRAELGGKDLSQADGSQLCSRRKPQCPAFRRCSRQTLM
jgi:hypothetical protein